jgi:hypothetical protein
VITDLIDFAPQNNHEMIFHSGTIVLLIDKIKLIYLKFPHLFFYKLMIICYFNLKKLKVRIISLCKFRVYTSKLNLFLRIDRI